MNYKLSMAFVGALSLAGTFALAQTAPGNPAGNQTIPEKDRSRPSDAPNGSARGGTAGDGSNLSDKLDAGGGVIKPEPGVDPEIGKRSRSASEFNARDSAPGDARGPPGPEPK